MAGKSICSHKQKMGYTVLYNQTDRSIAKKQKSVS